MADSQLALRSRQLFELVSPLTVTVPAPDELETLGL